MEFYFDDYDEKTDKMSISDLRGDRINETNGNYVAIDIETTGFAYRDDILEIAAVKVKDNSIVDTFQTLIKPTEPIPVNITALTGIDDEMVKDAPAFDDVIESFITFIGNDTIMGHHVTFDLDRLNNKLYNNNMQPINNCYIDTMYMSKDRIPSLDSYNLIGIANHLNVKIDVSHRALSDCYTTINCYNILITMPIAYIREKQKTHLLQKDIIADNTDFNEDHPLFGKTVVITGSLNGMSRKDAYLKIKNVGGLCGDSITKKTNYLVTNSTAKTGKMKKALQYIDEGFDIKIINEQDLYDLLGL